MTEDRTLIEHDMFTGIDVYDVVDGLEHGGGYAVMRRFEHPPKGLRPHWWYGLKKFPSIDEAHKYYLQVARVLNKMGDRSEIGVFRAGFWHFQGRPDDP